MASNDLVVLLVYLLIVPQQNEWLEMYTMANCRSMVLLWKYEHRIIHPILITPPMQALDYQSYISQKILNHLKKA
jgi:hypothetical protein